MGWQIRFAQTTDVQAIKALQSLLLPGDDQVGVGPSQRAWIGRDATGTPLAFCTARYWASERSLFLERAGVMPIAAGLGLQRRMIRLREGWARQCGADCVLTYTAPKNYTSLVNLLRSGYRFYDPAQYWAGPEMHYYRKDL